MLTAVVVLPTPPLIFVTATIFIFLQHTPHLSRHHHVAQFLVRLLCPCPGRSTRPANALSDRRSPGSVSIEMPNARHATCHLYNRRQNNPHLLLRHDEETDMTGYRILILIEAILITGCEALIFVGT